MLTTAGGAFGAVATHKAIEEGNEKLPDRCIATIWELYETSSLAIRSTVNGNDRSSDLSYPYDRNDFLSFVSVCTIFCRRIV